MELGEMATMTGILAVMCLIVVAVLSFVFQYFVALTAKPDRRAAWTAGVAYLATVLMFVFGGPEGYGYLAPVAALPGGLIAYYFWRSEFRRGWVDDDLPLLDGVKLANDNWQVGLGIVALAIVAGVVKWLARG